MLFYSARYIESGAMNNENTVNNEQISRKLDGEYSYLELIKLVLNNGQNRIDRTKTGTVSLFSPPPLVFNLDADGFPLLTTKKVGFKTVFNELMWFIKGQTDGTILLDKGVTIWEGHGCREYLDSIGLKHREERTFSILLIIGDLGPIYGFQWRHFGATYIDCKTDYTGQGYDQLKSVINQILFNPTSRRIIMSAWNPSDLSNMALPPCHMFIQFYVRMTYNGTFLDCQMYQRSADIGLGVPFNIASYSLLLTMICHVVGLKPGVFTHVIGDAHIYTDHVDALKLQTERTNKGFPELVILKAPVDLKKYYDLVRQGPVVVDSVIKELEDFTVDDFKVVGYNPYSKIAMKMSV